MDLLETLSGIFWRRVVMIMILRISCNLYLTTIIAKLSDRSSSVNLLDVKIVIATVATKI